MKKIRVGNRQIGEGNPCFIIAEAGVNHNGDVKSAKKLIDIAKDAEADAVKFQTFKAEGVVTEMVPMVAYQQETLGIKKSQLEMLRQYELDYTDFRRLKKYCDKKDIIFLSTPHTMDSIDFLDDLVPAFKFASGDLTNTPALMHAAKKCKPMILGTGMSTLSEVKEALNSVYNQGNKDVIMLHCTTNYPCPLEEVNFRAMQTMQKKLDCLIGYSDHTLGLMAPLMAVSLGAVLIEKHFTLDKNMEGPDHKASLNPEELKEMVRTVRDVETALGDGTKQSTINEEKIKEITRKSIVAKIAILKGTMIENKMLDFKRPGSGIEPKLVKFIVGKVANKDIKKDEILSKGMLS